MDNGYYGADGYQWNNSHVEIAQAYKSGGMWRHFVPYSNYDNCSCGSCSKCQKIRRTDGYRHNHSSGKKELITDVTFAKYFGGNLNGLKNLKDITAKREANKVVYIDFEYLFSLFSTISNSPNYTKTIQKESFNKALQMLNYYGFKITVMMRAEDSEVSHDFFVNNNYVEIVIFNEFQDKFNFMLMNEPDITKVFYVSSDLGDISNTNGSRNPIYITCANSLYINRNVADYISNSSYHDNALNDIITAILLSFDINPFTYFNKTRMNMNANVVSNYVNNIAKNYVITESSTKFNDVYSVLLNQVYEIYPIQIGQAYSSIGSTYQGTYGEHYDDIYIITDWKYAIDHIDAFRYNRIFLFTDSMDVTNITLQESLKALDKVEMIQLNWSIPTKHFSNDVKNDLYNYLIYNKLYNVLGMLDMYDPIIYLPT